MIILHKTLSNPKIKNKLSPNNILSFIIPNINLYIKLSIHTNIIHRITTYTQHNILTNRILKNKKSKKLLIYNLFLLTIITIHRQYLNNKPN